MDIDTIEAAEDLFFRWHEFKPGGIINCNIPTPRPPLELLGRILRIDYSSIKWKRKMTIYQHFFKTNAPLLMRDLEGNPFRNGKVKVMKDGIDDWDSPQRFGKPRTPPEIATQIGVLQLISYIAPSTQSIGTILFGDRYFIAAPTADWIFVSSATNTDTYLTIKEVVQDLLYYHDIPVEALNENHPLHSKALGILMRSKLYQRHIQGGNDE